MDRKSVSTNTHQNTQINVVQLNCRRSTKVLPELRQKAVENGIDIMLLQEPYSRDNKLIGLGMGTRIIKDDSEHPWAAIAVLNPELQVLKLSHLCSPHLAVAQVSNRTSNFYIASAYFQLSHDIEPHIENLEQVLISLGGRNTIVGIDSNAKSPFWGARKRDQKGKLLEDFIAEWRLVVVNNLNDLPTTCSEVGEGHVDVTLTTASVTSKCFNWKVRDGWTSSDHRAITFEIKSTIKHKLT